MSLRVERILQQTNYTAHQSGCPVGPGFVPLTSICVPADEKRATRLTLTCQMSSLLAAPALPPTFNPTRLTGESSVSPSI